MSTRHLIRREALFDAIWGRPMTHVARDYGISDVALKKICRKLGLPTPPRGHWRRKELGYPVESRIYADHLLHDLICFVGSGYHYQG